MAELYAIATLFLSYFQTLKIRDRMPVSLALIPVKDWLKVNIYIPTYNEDVEIVHKTVLGAIAIDYPPEKKRVYVLDDGRAEKYKACRIELQGMCDELGIQMLVRDNNEHAKAGNINTALPRTQGDLVLWLRLAMLGRRLFKDGLYGVTQIIRVASLFTDAALQPSPAFLNPI